MARSNNSRRKGKQEPKAPKKMDRKDNRSQWRVDCAVLGHHVEYDLEQERYEKKYVPLSPAHAAKPCEVYRCISIGDFRAAMRILEDPCIESEEKKHLAVTYKCSTYRTTVTHEAIRCGAPYELVELLVFIGGKDVVTTKDSNGYNPIHLACKRGANPDVVAALSEVGGKDALNAKDNYGELPIHKASSVKGASTEVVKTLLKFGGHDMLGCKNKDGMLAVHSSVYFFNTNLEVCKILVTKGLHHGVGGEEGLGGLNVEYTDLNGKRKTTMKKLRQTKILDCLLEKVKDEVPIKHGTNAAEAGAKHGLKWQDGMKELVEATDRDAVKIGLITFAASGEKIDLTTIYELSKRHAGLFEYATKNGILSTEKIRKRITGYPMCANAVRNC
jgi:ankyrin repeat protein